MYLKSLALKGFKSFADRSVLSLEPGITAIVGPNGSGKSNISDAVLWVLGERNARHLRGQSMEDIIFSGSSARKPVSVAEVDLVLDNSDRTLPVDFDEVAITRRMYRSGESEYLINGTIARRMDVLDILHDSGLGTGTHSIISQGSLDSILQSSPQDRRALIEEAAGVLKHKQRKEKSLRKLEKMDNSLARVRDVASELERQLKPLERKAKRARAYEEASGELAHAKLVLAVDDLRRLQQSWDAVCAQEKELAGAVEAARGEVGEHERTIASLQAVIQKGSADAGALARAQRRASQAAERLDSAERLVRERRRAAQSYAADLQISLEEAAAKRAAARRELDEARHQFAQADEAFKKADARAGELAQKRKEASRKRQEAEHEADNLASALKRTERERDAQQRKRAQLADSLSSGIAREKLVEARRVELEESLDAARGEFEGLKTAHEHAQASLERLQAEEKSAKDTMAQAFSERDAARAARDEAADAVRVLASEIRAVETAQRAAAAEDPALLWLLDNAEAVGGDLAPVAQAIKAPTGLESLVERLLGADAEAVSVADAQGARTVAAAVQREGRAGDVALVARAADRASKAPQARACSAGRALVDELSYPESARGAVEALLGDIVVCATRDDAFAAHEQDESGLRFASEDGCIVWPTGKVQVLGAQPEQHEGALARERRLEELRGRLKEAEAERDRTAQAAAAAEETYRAAQTESLKASQRLAAQQGTARSARQDFERAEKRLASATSELESIERQRTEAKSAVEKLRPDVEAVEATIGQLEESLKRMAQDQEETAQRVAPLRREAGRLADELTQAKLEAAQLKERRAYASRMVDTRAADIDRGIASERSSRATIAVKHAVERRAVPLADGIELLASELRRRLRSLDDAIDEAESASQDVRRSEAAAREEAKTARSRLDATIERMNQTRVEKGRLEVRVDEAVRVITEDCATPLDHAKELAAPEDRTSVEDQVATLTRRIKKMGAINPDAAAEYEQLKKRYDFMVGQLHDMESATRSLGRITRAIDRRMKDDFERTYDQVNKDFGEIFSTLFPGGSARLALEDPDDMEHTGVEVEAQPRGKRITKMSLMSGGEKSLTAMALLFAVYRTRATPFYILDEVEAALDDTNLRRLVAYIDSLRSTTQFIMITHQRRTMEMADVLFGVSMQSDGVTKVISQKLEHALKNAE